MKDQWILAKVLDFDEKARTYKLDVQPRAAIDRVRLREMSQAETTEVQPFLLGKNSCTCLPIFIWHRLLEVGKSAYSYVEKA